MSGHSKWHSIKHKKGIADAQRGKVFTRHAHLITIAARKGGDLSTNPTLRLTIDNAKKDNLPNLNIERAIKRGTGELKDAAEIHEEVYEGYGPAGIAVIVESLTDNKNRTFTNLRTLFDKRGGSLGSVAWMFDRKGVIEVTIPAGRTSDDAQMAIIDAGADDFDEVDATHLEVYCAMQDLHRVQSALEKSGLTVDKAEIRWLPKETVKITDKDEAQKIINFMDALEENEDVGNIASNFEIDEEVMKALEQ